MKFLSITTCIIVLALTGHSNATNEIDLRGVSFERLTSTGFGSKPAGGGLVSMTVQVLSEGSDSPYRKLFADHETWPCIAMITDALVGHLLGPGGQFDAMAATMGINSTAGPDSIPELRLLWSHSGQEWTFWQHLAHLGVLVYDMDADVTVGPEMSRILTEMESAFLELLDPKDAEVFMFGRVLADPPTRRPHDGE